jgi:predicted nucleotidyltransferase
LNREHRPKAVSLRESAKLAKVNVFLCALRVLRGEWVLAVVRLHWTGDGKNLLYNLFKMTAIEVPTVDKRKRIPQQAIDEVVRQIAEQFHLGSYARGNPRPESDVDLLVVTETALKESQQSHEIRRHLGVMFGLDLIVYTPERLRECAQMGDWFLRDVLKGGKIVYEAG